MKKQYLALAFLFIALSFFTLSTLEINLTLKWVLFTILLLLSITLLFTNKLKFLKTANPQN